MPHFLRDETIYMHCLLKNKAKHILNRHVSSSCSDTIYSKSTKKNRKNPHFRKFIISLLVQIFECKGVSSVSSDHIIYFNKEKVDTKSLICQIIIVNQVPNFHRFFPNNLLKIFSCV